MCTQTELCLEVAYPLIISIDLIVRNYYPRTITDIKNKAYAEMVKRGDAKIDPKTGHAIQLGVRWCNTRSFEAEYREFLNIRK